MRIGTYRVADRVLGQLNKVELPGAATSLVELDSSIGDDPDIAVRYQNTNVLIFRANDDVVFNHGGWTTGTTAKRMAGWGPENVEILYDRGKLGLKVEDVEHWFGDNFALVVHPDGKVEPYEGNTE
jgi:hypothetical protein